MTGESGKIEVRPIGGGTADDVKDRLKRAGIQRDTGKIQVQGGYVDQGPKARIGESTHRPGASS